MAAHMFNIGSPANAQWWQENLERRVITTGYENRRGGRGRDVLLAMAEGDTIIGYCNGKGFVGVGRVGPAASYRFHSQCLQASASDHQHERFVQWIYVVYEVDNAVSKKKAEAPHPRHARQELKEQATVKRITNLIRLAAAKEINGRGRSSANCWYVADAVLAMNAPSSADQIVRWLESTHHGENTDYVYGTAVMFSVNDADRRHHDPTRQDFRSDSGHFKDLLFKSESGPGQFRFEPYSPRRHGIWTIERDASGEYVAAQVTASTTEMVMAEAQAAEAQDLPIVDMPDERTRVLRLVVQRAGRKEFRDSLIRAYDGCCAISGCSVYEILEAAHIKPYYGSKSDRTDNGLLLRADIHTLFDKGLLWIGENLNICISPRLNGSEYDGLVKQKIRPTKSFHDRPCPRHLADHRNWALDQHHSEIEHTNNHVGGRRQR